MSAEPRRSLPAVAAQYEALTPVYDELFGDQFFSKQRRAFEQIERRYALRFSSAVDAGCGTGTFVAYLRARGVDPVWGVDRSGNAGARGHQERGQRRAIPATGSARPSLATSGRPAHLPVRHVELPPDARSTCTSPWPRSAARSTRRARRFRRGHATHIRTGRTHRLERAYGTRRTVTRRTRYLPRGGSGARPGKRCVRRPL